MDGLRSGRIKAERGIVEWDYCQVYPVNAQ